MTRQELARIALRAAIKIRRKAETPIEDPICIYDLAESIGVEVRFVGGGSFAGMFARGLDTVFVPSERPAGRRSFTCAHELAHWHFDHGERVERLDFDRDDRNIPEEILANQFAAYLLMPNRALEAAIGARGLNIAEASATQIYGLACQLGVGYDTIANHLCWSERMIDHNKLKVLQKTTPKEIRQNLLGFETSNHLVYTDTHWRKIPIDLEVGDYTIVPRDVTVSGKSTRIISECDHGIVIEAVKPGIDQALSMGNWAHMVRVSRKQFVGRGAFRHLEDDENDNNTTLNY